MESASLDRRAGEGYLEAPAERPLPPRAVAGIGGVAGAVAGAVMIGWQMLTGEIDNTPTAVPGIDSSTWTAITSVATLLLGVDGFHGSFHLGSILVGLILLMLYAVAFGVVGTALLAYVQGYHPGPIAAAMQGIAYGLLLEILVLNLGVNGTQHPNVVYESTVPWSWWAAHAAYGLTLCVVGAGMLSAMARTD